MKWLHALLSRAAFELSRRLRAHEQDPTAMFMILTESDIVRFGEQISLRCTDPACHGKCGYTAVISIARLRSLAPPPQEQNNTHNEKENKHVN